MGISAVPKQKQRQSEKRSSKRWSLGSRLGVGALVLLALYGVAWGAQKTWRSGNTAQLTELKSELEIEKSDIEAMETSLKTQRSALDARQREVVGLKAAGRTAEYNAAVPGFNAQVADYQAGVAEYEAKLTAYNAKVEEANALAPRGGSFWSLLPFAQGSQ